MALARMTWRFASSAPPPPPDPEEPPAPLPGDIDELVYPANRYWLDSGTAGQVLSPALGYSVGVTHEVTLYTQPGDWVPPADAVVLSGGNFVRGPGWANMRAGSYRMRIIKPGGSVTETDVRIATDAAATHTCTTEQQLTDAIAAVNADIASQGAAFPGAIIELSAANEWAPRTITINAGVGRTRRVYFRPIGADRYNAPRPRFRNLVTNACHLTDWHRIEALTYSRATAWFWTGASNYITRFDCYVHGGEVNTDGSINPAILIDPSRRDRPENSYFRTQYRSTLGPVDLPAFVPGHAPITQPLTAALGEWQACNPVGYVGDNAPEGITPMVFAKQPNWAGVEAQAEFEAETLSAGDPRIPADLPAGRYITRWRCISRGDGYIQSRAVGVNYTQDARFTTTWPGQRVLEEILPQGMASSSNPTLNMFNQDCSYHSLWEAQICRINNNDARWDIGTKTDAIYKDHLRTLNQLGQLNTRFTAHLLAFPVMGRGFSDGAMPRNPHGDWDQGAANDEQPPPFNGPRRIFRIRIGGLYDNGVTFPNRGFGPGPQGQFSSDATWLPADGFITLSFGNFYRSFMANMFAQNRRIYTRQHCDIVFNSNGGANDQWAPDGYWAITGTISQNQRATPAGRRRGAPFISTGGWNNAANFSAPTGARMESFADLRASFTGIGPAAGLGVFGDPKGINHEGRAWNPDRIPVEMVFLAATAAPGATVRSNALPLFYGHRAKAVSVSGGTYAKGPTQADAGTATATSAPGTLDPLVGDLGEWIALQGQAGPNPGDVVDVVVNIGGATSTFRITTEAS